VIARVEKNYAITIIIDIIMLDPAETRFDTENALRSTLKNPIVQNQRVS